MAGQQWGMSVGPGLCCWVGERRLCAFGAQTSTFYQY